MFSLKPSYQQHIGKFITFEGIDHSGKTTQIARVSEFLKERSIDHITTREPGGTPLGKEIRNYLLSGVYNLDEKTELYLIMAARSDHMEKVVNPALVNGQTVLCDRFVHSTRVHQYRIPEESEACWHIIPDMTILLDLDAEIAERRRTEKPDIFEARGIKYHQEARNKYVNVIISDRSLSRAVIVDASRTEDEVFDAIRIEVEHLLIKDGRQFISKGEVLESEGRPGWI